MGDMTAKLIDCGLAKLVPRMGNASASSRGVKGTYEYMCPQYQTNQLDEYKAECDIFSFGVVLAELWTGHVQNHQNHEDSTTGKRVNYYETYVLDQEDVLADMDDALDISDCTGMPEYAKAFARLSVQCMSRKLEKRPAGAQVLSQLQEILAKREQDSKENADIQQKQEAERPPTSSERMQCRDCRLKNVRCHPTPLGYICLPCLLLDYRRQVVAEIRESRYENQILHEKTHATLESFSGVLASLDARLVNRIPALLLLIPSEHSSFQKHPLEWLKDKARTTYYIYFVCAHSLRAVRTPLKFRVSKEWVLRIAPFLACSLYALRMAGKAVMGINLVVGGAFAEQFDTAKLTEMLESVMKLLEVKTDHVDLLKSLHSKRLDTSNLRRLDKDSMDPIVEFALAQRDWFHEMKHVHDPSGPGRSMWILNEYAGHFKTIV